MSNVLINQGTELPIMTDTVGTLRYQVIKLDVGASGAAVPFVATTPITVGTLNKGTVVGTVDVVSQDAPGAFATTIASGTSTLGTIKAAVGGSVIYVTDLVVSVGTVASNVTIASGGTSTPMMAPLSFAANGGMVSNFSVPIRTASGSALVYKQSFDGVLSITASGFVK